MTELKTRKAEIEAKLAGIDTPAPLMHPNMAGYYHEPSARSHGRHFVLGEQGQGGIGEEIAKKCTEMVGTRNSLCALFVVRGLPPGHHLIV